MHQWRIESPLGTHSTNNLNASSKRCAWTAERESGPQSRGSNPLQGSATVSVVLGCKHAVFIEKSATQGVSVKLTGK